MSFIKNSTVNSQTGESVDVEGLIERLEIRIERLELSDENVRGISIAGPQHQPGIIVNSNHAANGHSSGYRFTLAHELCHLLFDREAGRRLAVVTGPWAPRDVERRANAFAAMLLMPVSLVQQAVETLTVTVATVEGVREVASKLRAGRSAVLSHLRNLGFIDEARSATDRRAGVVRWSRKIGQVAKVYSTDRKRDAK